MFGVLALIFSNLAVAGPDYFKGVKGVLVTGFSQREAFETKSGEWKNCVVTGVAELIVYKCEIKDATATIETLAGKKINLRFDKLVTLERSYRGEVTKEYRFKGTFTEEAAAGIFLDSEAELHVWFNDASPNKLRGSISLSHYGVSAGFSGIRIE